MKLTQDVTDGMLRHVQELAEELDAALANGTMCALVIGILHEHEDGTKHRVSTTIDGNAMYAQACLTEVLKHYAQLATGSLPPHGDIDATQQETMQ